MRALLAALLLVAGCGTSQADEQSRLVVLGAASLTDVLAELEERFEQQHGGVDVVVSTGASSALAQQIVAGAPADVFVAASPDAMRIVTESGEAVGEPIVVARNRLAIAVPPGNPGRVGGLADLARADLDVALCAAQVPCGAAARQALEAAEVEARPDTLEQDVRAVLTRVRLGEVDAGVVYVTDVRAAGDEVEAITLHDSPVSDYPAVVLRGAGPLADDLVASLESGEGRELLLQQGFQ